jgi:Alpha galactosidase A C-terminal beta sandwich domain
MRNCVFLAIWNKRDDGTPYAFSQPVSVYGLINPTGYFIKNLYTNQDYGFYQPKDVLKVKVDPSGIIFFKATPVVARTFSRKAEEDFVAENLV